MARPIKKGLDYYPQDVDMFADRKIRKLLAEFGATGYLIYEFAKAQCYKENGYWVQCDDNFYFDVAGYVQAGINEALVNEVILACVSRFGLFNEKVFNEFKILTSAGIQRRYLQAKKNQTIVSEIWVIEEITPVNKSLNQKKSPASGIDSGLIPPDDPLSRDKSPESGVNAAESAQSKVKESKEEESKEEESKVDKNSFGEKKPEGGEESPEINVYENLEAFKKRALANSMFGMTVCQKGISPPLLPKWLDAFHRRLIFTEDTLKSEMDYRSHFARWLVRIPGYRTMHPDDYSPAKDAETPIAIGAEYTLTDSERAILAKYVL